MFAFPELSWGCHLGSEFGFAAQGVKVSLAFLGRGGVHKCCRVLVALQLAPLEDSPLAGAARNIPDKPFELDPDWEVDPESLEIMEKIGAPQFKLTNFSVRGLDCHACKSAKGCGVKPSSLYCVLSRIQSCQRRHGLLLSFIALCGGHASTQRNYLLRVCPQNLCHLLAP